MKKYIIPIALALICIVIIVIVIVITDVKTIIIVQWKNFRMPYKQGISLNYHEDIAYIEISDKGRLGLPEVDISNEGRLELGLPERNIRNILKIDDAEKIKKIIDYINSLELIEDKVTIPNFDYSTDLNSIGYFRIDIYKVNSEEPDAIVFMTNYLTFLLNGYDWEYTDYYIKNSGYHSKTANSKTFEFLYGLIHKSE